MVDNIFDNIKVQFEQFLSLVGNVLAHEKDVNIIQNKLRRHFNTASSSYLCSSDFRSLLNHIRSLFNENKESTKYFTLLASFDEQLKKHNIKLLGSYQSTSEVSNSTHNTESRKITLSINEKTAITSLKSSTTISLRSSTSTTNESNTSASPIKQTVNQLLDSCTNIFLALNESQLSITNDESKITTNSINKSECEIKQEKKINKLERRLSRLSNTIRKLEETDMSLDEMEHCDLYLVESNLKKRAYEIYTKLAELKNQSSSVERILDQPVTLTETEIGQPLIKKALEDMVNQTKFLPCFNDVLDTVEKTNDNNKLNLSVDARKNLAEKSFKIIGEKIKNRRMADFNDIMNSRLPEDFDIEQNDPALDNIDIEKKLLENEREAVSKTEQIFEKFSQIDPNLEPEVIIESSEESTIGSDEEGKGEEEDDEEEDNEEEGEMEPESKVIIEPSDNKHDETQYDLVDILPPFSSKSSSPSTPVATETINNKDPVEATVEIPLNDRTLTILSTPSIPLKRATCDSFTSIVEKTEPEIDTVLQENGTQESQHIATIHEHKVQTIIPRRPQRAADNETSYNLYRQRLTNDSSSIAQKRPSSKDIESSKSKKIKEPPEIVILD